MKQSNSLLDDIERMEVEMDRLFDEVIPPRRWLPLRHIRTWRPPTDVYETDNCVVVKVEIAGMKEGDFTISLSSRNLVITGARHDPVAEVQASTLRAEPQGEALSYQQMEIRYGEFKTEVYLPWAIVGDKIEATYENGFLKVILPKAKAQQVPVVVCESERIP
jgi:HSP20 family molecular chaperone IbpA